MWSLEAPVNVSDIVRLDQQSPAPLDLRWICRREGVRWVELQLSAGVSMQFSLTMLMTSKFIERNVCCLGLKSRNRTKQFDFNLLHRDCSLIFALELHILACSLTLITSCSAIFFYNGDGKGAGASAREGGT